MISIPEIPHGHGLSFKKGIVDGLLDGPDRENEMPNGHQQSYKRGKEVGIALNDEISKKVKP